MPDEALLDAPEVEDVDLGTETTDSDIDSSSSDDSTRVDAGTTTRDDSTPVITDSNGQLKLSETARAELDKIKADNPRLAREMRAALFDRQTLLAKVPGGVKEALATIEAYEAEGGSEAVQAAKEEVRLWQDLDADFQAGEPKFVDDIAAGNPEAFAKLAPMVMTKFSELAPDSFSYHVSKVFAQDMAANDVALNMRLLQREIQALPEASRGEIQKLWNALAGYVDRVNGMAKTAPKTESKTIATPTGNSDIDQREQALTIREFSSERTKVMDSVTSSEFSRNAGTRKFSAEKISTIQELYDLALDRMVKSIPGHTAKVDRFVAAKDKAGYRKHMEAAIRSKAPEAMAQAFRKAGVGAKPGVAAKPAAKPAAGAAKLSITGFTRTAIKPNKNDVNWQATNLVRRTPADSNKYVMNSREKLLWQR